MWNLSKYDSIEAFKIPKIKKIFPRYINIVKKDLPANFQIANKIVVEIEKNMSEEEIWKEHRNLMNRFKETRAAIDKGKLILDDLEKPRFSLIDLKIMMARNILSSCDLCEHRCKIDRTNGEIGKCQVRTTENCHISSEFIHKGEEPYISPSHTIFLMGCNLDCQFCQNWKIARFSEKGKIMTPKALARAIHKRKLLGSRNVNWVGGEPTPHLLSILNVLKETSVNIPQIWNSNFYMSKKTMVLLDGIVDMYLSDFKYGNDDCAYHLSKIPNYLEIVKRNHEDAALQTEMTIRHLILPDHVDCCSKPFLKWLSTESMIRKKSLVSILDQYKPNYKANEYMSLKKPLHEAEKDEVLNYAKRLRLRYVG